MIGNNWVLEDVGPIHKNTVPTMDEIKPSQLIRIRSHTGDVLVPNLDAGTVHARARHQGFPEAPHELWYNHYAEDGQLAFIGADGGYIADPNHDTTDVPAITLPHFANSTSWEVFPNSGETWSFRNRVKPPNFLHHSGKTKKITIAKDQSAIGNQFTIEL